MRTAKHGILAAIAFLLVAGAASGQTYSDVSDRVVSNEADLSCEWYLGPHIGYTFLGDDDFRSLFITASTSLYRIRMKTPGTPQMV